MYTGSLGTVSTRENWIQAVDVVDENGVDVTITGATIRLAVRKKGDAAPTLTADTDDGIVISTPTFTWSFTPDEMGSLCPSQYDVGVTIEIDGETTQLIKGTVEIVDGIVTAP